MRPTNGRTCLIVNRVAQYAPAIAVTVVSIGLIGYMIALRLRHFPDAVEGLRPGRAISGSQGIGSAASHVQPRRSVISRLPISDLYITSRSTQLRAAMLPPASWSSGGRTGWSPQHEPARPSRHCSAGRWRTGSRRRIRPSARPNRRRRRRVNGCLQSGRPPVTTISVKS